MEEGKYTNMPEAKGPAGKPLAEEGKYKSIPAILPLAPGGVYAVKWETREKWAEPLKTPPVDYTPPLGPPNPDNPLCYFEIRAGGYYLGRVVFEVKADTHPVTSENFVKLCEYKCYAGTMFQVFPGNWIRGEGELGWRCALSRCQPARRTREPFLITPSTHSCATSVTQ